MKLQYQLEITKVSNDYSLRHTHLPNSPDHLQYNSTSFINNFNKSLTI